ncbi:MAG: ABC transporter permease [Neisseriaceae bacterium]|nr:ABC transporter permease [Neisseriaceae bacterium]
MESESISLLSSLSAFFSQYGLLLLKGTWDTLVMTTLSTLFAYILGIPLGVILILTSKHGLMPKPIVYSILGGLVNIGRSIPFIILIVFMIPFTRMIVGTSLGVAAAIVPLTVATTPFVARMIEQSLREVNKHLIEAAQSFGANTWQIISKVFLAESMPSLVRGMSITFISVFGFVAMAGTVGAGGIGDIAIRYGYQRYENSVMIASIILSIVLVQIAQSITNIIAVRIDHRKH